MQVTIDVYLFILSDLGPKTKDLGLGKFDPY